MKPADRRPADRLMVEFLYSGPAAITLLACDHSLSARQTRLPGPSRKPHAGVGTPGERPIAIRPRRPEGSGSHFARHLAVNRWRRIGPDASISIGFVFRPAIGIAVNPFASLRLFDDFRAPAAAFGCRLLVGLLDRRRGCLGRGCFAVRPRRRCVFSLFRLRFAGIGGRHRRGRLRGLFRLRFVDALRWCSGIRFRRWRRSRRRHRNGRLFRRRHLLLRRYRLRAGRRRFPTHRG